LFVVENRPATPIPIAHTGSKQTTTKYIACPVTADKLVKDSMNGEVNTWYDKPRLTNEERSRQSICTDVKVKHCTKTYVKLLN